MAAKAKFSIEPIPMAGDGPPAWLVVDLGEFSIPRHFKATTRVGDLAAQLEVEVDDAGKPHCRGLAVQPPQGGEVRADALRKVSVPRLLEGAMTAAAQKVVPPTKAGTPTFHIGAYDRELHSTLRPPSDSERRAFYERYAAGARRPRSGTPLTDDNLEQVATVYREAIKAGDPPTQTVADAMNVARSTAARWVAAARKRGFLGPAMPGRGGEREEKS